MPEDSNVSEDSKSEEEEETFIEAPKPESVEQQESVS